MNQGRRNGSHGGNPPVGQGLLTVHQVAKDWQVSERSIRRMIADGRLPVVRLGRAVRIEQVPGWNLLKCLGAEISEIILVITYNNQLGSLNI
jgi:excisionase family DNA binding protein